METAIIFCWIFSILLTAVFLLRAIYSTLTKETKEAVIKKETIKRISDGMLVKMQYTLSDKNGNIIETKGDTDPFTYVHGIGEIIAGLEKRLRGLKAGAKKKVVVPPNEAYGEFDPGAIKEVKKEIIPEDALKVGVLVKEIGVDKKPGTILEIKENTVIIDYNHPLAGKKLVYNVDILYIEDIRPDSSEKVFAGQSG